MGLGGIEFYRVLSSFTEFYRVLQGFQKGSPNKVPSFTVWLLEKKMKRKLGGIEFYRVLPSFTEFYRVFKKVRQIRFRVLPFGCWEKKMKRKLGQKERNRRQHERRRWLRLIVPNFLGFFKTFLHVSASSRRWRVPFQIVDQFKPFRGKIKRKKTVPSFALLNTRLIRWLVSFLLSRQRRVDKKKRRR